MSYAIYLVSAMTRKSRLALLAVGGIVIAAGIGGAVLLIGHKPAPSAAIDPRQEPPIVRVSTANPVLGADRRFTGVIAARVQSNLGFRVPGKVVERLVNVGQSVKAGQPLLRVDETDLRLALTAKRNAAIAARAVLTQATADEARYAVLVKNGFAASPQRYEQAKAALDTAKAQATAAEAEANVAENELHYAVLVADADGIIVETLAEPSSLRSQTPVFCPSSRTAPSGTSFSVSVAVSERRIVTVAPSGASPASFSRT